MKDHIKILEKSLLLIIPGFFIMYWLQLYDSDIFKNSKQLIFSKSSTWPLLIVTTATFLIVLKSFFEKAIKEAKSEQRLKNYGIMVSFLEAQIRDLTVKLQLSEEEKNRIKSSMIFLSQLKDVPELSLYLMEKMIAIIDDYKTQLNVYITGNLKSLQGIHIEDLKQTLNLMMMPILQNFDNIEVENRGEINLFIREQDSQIIFKVMHDYIGDPINVETMEWNIRKILQKYGGSFRVENEREDDLNVLSLTMDIPKENKMRKSRTA